MNAVTARPGPEWLSAEMPAGYHNRLAEIERLSADLREMEKFGRLLHEVGEPLQQAVRDVFTALRFEAGAVDGLPGTVAVRLGPKQHLLIQVSEATRPIDKRSPELAGVFRILHEVAEESDRVVLLTNVQPETRPTDRASAVTPDAEAFLVRLGASHVSATTLFAIWKLALESIDGARSQVERLYAQSSGTFDVPTAVRV